MSNGPTEHFLSAHTHTYTHECVWKPLKSLLKQACAFLCQFPNPCCARTCRLPIGCWWCNASWKCVYDWTGGSFKEPAVESLAWRSVARLWHPSRLLHALPQCTLGCASPLNIALTGNLEKQSPIPSFVHLVSCPVKSLAHLSDCTHVHAYVQPGAVDISRGFYNNCCFIITLLCGGWSSV